MIPCSLLVLGVGVEEVEDDVTGSRSEGSCTGTGMADFVVKFFAGSYKIESMALRLNGCIPVLRNAAAIVVVLNAFSRAVA